MKIVFLGRYNETETLSGPEKVAKRIFTELESKTNSVFLEYFFDGTKYSIWKKLFGFESIHSHEGMIIIRIGLLRLLVFLVKFNPDIIHIMSFERYAIVSFLVKFFIRSKYIYTIHSTFVYESSRSIIKTHRSLIIKNKICEYLLLRFSNRLIFVSEHCLNYLCKYYKVNKKNISIINNGIDGVFYNPNREFIFSKPLKIVFFNGINSGINRKFDFIIDVLNRFDKSEIVLYNITELEPSMTPMTKFELFNIAPMATEVLSAFFQDKHILLKSPIYDSFPILCLEAMASGLICIVSEEVGMKFLIENNVSGIIYDSQHSETLELILKNILNNNIDIKVLSENARQIFHNYSWEKIAEKYYLLYNELLRVKN